jgi:fluoride ion exporter CrcB/FEX
MDNQNHTGFLSILTTIISTIFGWITLLEAQYMMSFGLTCIGVVSGIFAIRYYYHAGNHMRDKRNQNK